jgi:hypothetical protein
MTERDVLWDWDLDDPAVEPENADDSVTDHEPNTEPIPVVEAEEQLAEQSYEEMWANDERETSYARPFLERVPGSPITTLTFKPAPSPWYRRKPAVIALIAAAAVALLFAILPSLMRGPASAPEDSTGVAPAPATSAEPASASRPPPTGDARPALTSAPAPAPPRPPLPPPPTPPPPPAPAQDDVPAYTPYYPAPRDSSPSRSNKPDIGVTRAPISVAPDVHAPPPDDAKVGDGRRRRGFW